MRVRLRDGTRLYFDVAGMGLVPEGPLMRERPTLLCLHGGPGFDHSLLKSALAPLADTAQVVFLDHRGQGRSDRSAPDRWNLDTWIEDVVDFCGALELEHPVVLGQSFGGVVALGVAIRHPDLVARLIVSSSIGRSTTRRRSIGTRSHYRPAPGGRVPLLPRRGIHLRLVRRARADPVPEPDPRRRPRPDHHPRRSRRAGRGDPRLAARGLRRRRPRLPRQARGGAERDPGVRGRSVVGRAPRPGRSCADAHTSRLARSRVCAYPPHQEGGA